MELQLVEVTKTVSLRRGHHLSVLDGVNLDASAGDSIAILGRSGSGKSTLLSILGLLDSPTSGKYLIDGVDTGGLRSRKLDYLRGRAFGFIFQRFCLMSHLTALENVEAAGIHRGERRSIRRARALEVLDQVGLANRAGHRPGQMSGGEQQRVAIARALAGRPAVLLADEPTGSLDEVTGTTVIGQLHELSAQSQVILLVVTHDPLVAQTCERTVHLDQGKADL